MMETIYLKVLVNSEDLKDYHIYELTLDGMIKEQKLKNLFKVKNTVRQNILDFLIEIDRKGKGRLTKDESKQLETLYNNYYRVNEKIAGCDICAIRMYQRLSKAVNYKQTKKK